jgi:hypothetical protein
MLPARWQEAIRSTCLAIPIVFSAIALLHIAAKPVLAGVPSYSFRSPFDAQQCDRAIHFGQEAVQSSPSGIRSHLILAEGLLCHGIAADDPWALDRAIAEFRNLAELKPSDFFIHLDLFDALRKRWPLAPETATILKQARALFDAAGLGERRQAIKQYIDQNAAAMAHDWANARTLLEKRGEAATRGTLHPGDMFEYLVTLAAAGPTGLTMADKLFDHYTGNIEATGLVLLAHAELLRGRVPRSEAQKLYNKAQQDLCRDGASIEERTMCPLASVRSKQIALLIGALNSKIP